MLMHVYHKINFEYFVYFTMTVSKLYRLSSINTNKVMIIPMKCLQLFSSPGCDINGPLGMISGEIQDWQITASSTYPPDWDRGCHERHARVYQPNKLGWCAKYKSSSEWLQVDLGVSAKVCKRILEPCFIREI